MGTNNSNEITIYTTSTPGGIAGSSLNNVVEVTNNRARQYAELAKGYMEQAKSAKNDAQYYAEQNSDVTKVYVDGIKSELQNAISLRQPAGNYALKTEIPVAVSELTNDSEYLTTANIATTLDLGVVKVDGTTISADGNGVISSIRADKDLSNLTSLGNARLQYAPFAINSGAVLNGENNTLTYSGSDLTCAPCMITTCDGRTKDFATSSVLDVSGEADGNYSVFKDYTDGSLSLINSNATWVQPVLIANGTVGGDSFACTSISNTTYQTSILFQLFDGNTSTTASMGSSNTNPPSVNSPQDIIFYTPKPLKISKVVMTNIYSYASNYVTRAGGVYGSNDNVTYTLITNYTNSNTTASSVWNIDCSSNTKYYKYIKVTSTQTDGTYTWAQSEMSFEGLVQLDYNIDAATVPANFYVNGTVNNDIVYIGDVTISSGSVTGIKNNQFNMNGYTELMALPDFGKKVSITNGVAYIAGKNGWIVTDSQVIKPLFIGEIYTPSSTGYYFAPLKGI